MRLNDPLITSFLFDGKEYSIDLAFDNVLDVFDVLDEKELREDEAIEIALDLLLGEQEYTPSIDLWNHVFTEFIAIERKKPIEYDRKGNPMPTPDDEDDDKVHFSLHQDAEYIYASFMQAYQMDLYQQQGKLQWRQFSALLDGLPDDTRFRSVMRIRNWKPSKYDDEEHKREMKKLQKIYALNDSEEVD